MRSDVCHSGIKHLIVSASLAWEFMEAGIHKGATKLKFQKLNQVDDWPAQWPKLTAELAREMLGLFVNSNMPDSNPNDVLECCIFPKHPFHRQLIKITLILAFIEANQISWIIEMYGFRMNIFRIVNCLKMLPILDKSCLITIKQQNCTHVNRSWLRFPY